MISLLVAAVASLLVTLAPPAAHAASPWHVPPFHGDPFDSVVTFGDSLSDPGNAFVATRAFVVRPFDPIPDAPYAIGGFHFSNGRTWIEYLTRDLGLPQSGKPALRVPGLFTNYAQGAGGGIAGARARTVGEVGEVNLGSEIALYLGDFKDSDRDDLSDMLYVIWIGSNDLRDALATPAQAGSIVSAALLATHAGIQQLYDAGARSFLVLNLPDLAITPAINTLPDDVKDDVGDLSAAYNGGLEQTLSLLEALNPDIIIARLDVFTILNKAADDPASVGLVNAMDSCITPGVIVGAICRRPNTYLFWDFIHPTTKAHRLLSEEAKAALVDTFDGFASVADVARPGGAMLSSR